MAQENKGFLHIDGDESFKSRAKSVFDSLNSLEPSQRPEESRSRDVLRAGKRRRPNHVPDHVLHPQKWTKYSLEEDGSKSLGRMTANEVNRHAALTFLDELKNRKESTEKVTPEVLDSTSDVRRKQISDDDKNHHAYSKPCNTNADSAPKAAVIKQGVNVMPEYVVGRTKVPAKSKTITHSSTSHSSVIKTADVHIGHLLDSDVDESEMITDGPKCDFSKSKHGKKRNIRKHRSDDDE